MNGHILKRVLGVSFAEVPAAALVAQLAFADPWWTRDQQGMRFYRSADYPEAVARFTDSAWRAAALYRDGRFEDAASMWSGIPGAEAAYNRGNALTFRGQYEDAVASYERALELRPGWAEAETNRRIAESRIRTETALGEASELGADDVVFDPNMKKGAGDQVEVTGGDQLSDAELRALWLRNVQTEPADFLRVKFAYQRAVQSSSDAEPEEVTR